MAADFEFSRSQFLWIVFIFVGVPTAVAAFTIRSGLTKERALIPPPSGGPGIDRTGRGRLGLWATGSVAFTVGFVACVGWLSWTAADRFGEAQGPQLPPPTQFPTWQIVASGITVAAGCFASAHLSRWALAGGLSAAAGAAAGFTTAFGISASADTTGLSGVGMLMSEVGWGIGLGVLMCLRGKRLLRWHEPAPAPQRFDGF